ncbi:MAG: extensin family protein [Jhaorihella sp.]
MRGWKICAVLAAFLLGAVPVSGQPPDRSPRPVERPDQAPGIAASVGETAHRAGPRLPEIRPAARPAQPADISRALPVQGARQEVAALIAASRKRPQPRPVSAQLLDAAARPGDLPFLAPDTSPFPWARPDGVTQKAMSKRRKLRRGAICGNIDIQGDQVGRVPGQVSGCGIRDAVKVRSVSGVRLSRGAVMDCDTARALNTWVERGVKPAFRRRGPVVELQVAAHYACRTRNNQRGARISEHGKGKAIDISAFVMKDGEVITVAKGWGQGTTLKPLNKAWRTACGPFGTVLGPKADRYHWNHFHLDTASYRSGPYCK